MSFDLTLRDSGGGFNVTLSAIAKTGTAAGSLSLSGSATGTHGGLGTAAGALTALTGEATGTAEETPPAPVVTPSGGAGWYRRQYAPPRPAPVEHRAGRASGALTITGSARGRKSIAVRIRSTVRAAAEVRGRKGARGDTWSHVTTRAAVRGTGISMVPHNHVRQLREDAELLALLLTKEMT